jgi:hypothetical protein
MFCRLLLLTIYALRPFGWTITGHVDTEESVENGWITTRIVSRPYWRLARLTA